MPSEEQISISKLRLDIAKERLSYADEILKIGDYKTVANRSYYAVFSAMRAVLALDGFDSKKHSGIIAEFRRLYLKTEILPKELSETIDSLVEVRKEIVVKMRTETIHLKEIETGHKNHLNVLS